MVNKRSSSNNYEKALFCLKMFVLVHIIWLELRSYLRIYQKLFEDYFAG